MRATRVALCLPRIFGGRWVMMSFDSRVGDPESFRSSNCAAVTCAHELHSIAKAYPVEGDGRALANDVRLRCLLGPRRDWRRYYMQLVV